VDRLNLGVVMDNYVKMTNGTLIADVYNSEETIANARKCGYELVKEEPKKEEKKVEVKEEAKEEVKVAKTTSKKGKK